MKGLFKKAVVLVLAVMMLLSANTAVMAHSEMENMVFAGYDTTDWSNPNKIYNEVIGGKYTNKQVLVPVSPTWKVEGYEKVYPYAGYSRMYLEGNKQDITAYNSLFPQWETRRRDYMWEMKAPYYVYERQQTKVDGKTWTWDFGNEKFNIPDSALLTKTVKQATVVNIEFKNYGFGKYNNKGALLTAAEQAMYNAFGVNAVADWNRLVSTELTPSKLGAQDDYGRYVITDADIAAMIPVVQSKYITAKFNETGNEGLATKSVAAEFLKHGTNWAWDYDSSFKTVNTAKISWTTPVYELCEPYRQYQYLVINDVVFDGTNGKEAIWRYTGGLANPKITWNFAFFQHARDAYGNLLDDVFEVVEQKYVDGVPGVDANGAYIYRVPTGTYGKTFFVVNKTNKTVEYWITDHAGHSYIYKTFPCDNGNVTTPEIIDAYMSGALHYDNGVVKY